MQKQESPSTPGVELTAWEGVVTGGKASQMCSLECQPRMAHKASGPALPAVLTA